MHIPSDLLAYKQWVLWRRAEVSGRLTKIPISPWSGKAAACDMPQTWSTYRHARYAMSRFRCNGIGFVFTASDPFCGIDLDQCRTIGGDITSEALTLIRHVDSYSEVSPSGTGVHILLKAKLPERGRRREKIELYDAGRYFTITGKHIAGTPLEPQDRQDKLDQVMTATFPPATSSPIATISGSLDISDEEIIERAMQACNGERFRRLWTGNASDYGDDHSRADLALCNILAFWTGGNAERMDRLFRLSSLMRDKWDRPSGSASYGARTILISLASRK